MDITTMVLALALGNLTLCAALFFHQAGQPHAPALAWFATARQCQAAAWLLLTLRSHGVVPDPLAIPAGYALLFAGIACEGGAAWEAAGRSGWRRPTTVALAVSLLLFVACYLIDDTGVRVVAGSLLLGAWYLAAAVPLALHWRDASLLRRVLALSCAALALLVAARGVLVLTMPGGWGWLSSGVLAALSSVALYLLMLAGAFGALLLAREQQQQELARVALVDTLTEVPNRRGFFDKLAPWLALARRPGPPTALVLLDLDQFKRVNDSYGHPAGDAVLRQVIEVCKKQLRDSDQLGRMVGVEFALLLPRTGMADALLVAERMRAAIAGGAIKTERAMISLTASFGVTTIRADDSSVSLFKRADAALQAAKAGGRNQVAEAAEQAL